jgi:hypothetical protein
MTDFHETWREDYARGDHSTLNSSVSLIRNAWVRKGFRLWNTYNVHLYNAEKFIKTSTKKT